MFFFSVIGAIQIRDDDGDDSICLSVRLSISLSVSKKVPAVAVACLPHLAVYYIIGPVWVVQQDATAVTLPYPTGPKLTQSSDRPVWWRSDALVHLWPGLPGCMVVRISGWCWVWLPIAAACKSAMSRCGGGGGCTRQEGSPDGGLTKRQRGATAVW